MVETQDNREFMHNGNKHKPNNYYLLPRKSKFINVKAKKNSTQKVLFFYMKKVY